MSLVLALNLTFSGDSGVSQEKNSEGGRLGQIVPSAEGCMKVLELVLNACEALTEGQRCDPIYALKRSPAERKYAKMRGTEEEELSGDTVIPQKTAGYGGRGISKSLPIEVVKNNRI